MSSATAIAQLSSACSKGAVASMAFARAGLTLRRTGVSLQSNSFVRLPVVTPLLVRRSYMPVRKVVLASQQWKMDAPGGFEVEIDTSNEFPRPTSVPFSKDIANTVHLIGNVGRDMDIKYLDTGKVVAKTSLAVLRTLKKDDPPSWYVSVFKVSGRIQCLRLGEETTAEVHHL